MAVKLMRGVIGLMFTVVAAAGPGVGAAAMAGQTRAVGTQPTTQPTGQQSKLELALPGVHVDLVHKTVDLDAKVSRRAVKWLELLACKPGTRDYESLLTIKARPRDIQLALLMVGLKPGHPLKSRLVNGHFLVTPPTGPKVRVWIVVKGKDGKERQIPANRWIVDQKTGKVMRGNTWLFVGSRFVQYNGKQVFLADLNGSIISLVNFGDEVLARATNLTNQNDNQIWNANAKMVPKAGTHVLVRLQPVGAGAVGANVGGGAGGGGMK